VHLCFVQAVTGRTAHGSGRNRIAQCVSVGKSQPTCAPSPRQWAKQNISRRKPGGHPRRGHGCLLIKRVLTACDVREAVSPATRASPEERAPDSPRLTPVGYSVSPATQAWIFAIDCASVKYFTAQRLLRRLSLCPNGPTQTKLRSALANQSHAKRA